ncbi:MAG TPA: hypothetical protein VH724_10990 [Candidatus Angelobacter sp.]|nr:hypothetical protein [Candidatus Angelobacter sp.]
MATTLQEWGDVLVGDWTIQRTSPLEKGGLSVQSGSLSVRWTEGNSALAATTQPAAGVGAGNFIATMDPASGQIKQNTVYPDGSTETTFISKVADGQWEWKQTRNFANGQQETNNATFTVTNNGNTLVHNVTGRTLAHSSLGKLALADTRNILTRAS